MKSRMAVILAASALLLVQQTRAQQPPPQPRGPQRAPDAIKTVLDLTERQFTELNDLRDQHNKKLHDISAQLRELERQRREAMAAGTDPTMVGSLALQIQSLQPQMQDENKAYHDNALRVLDSTQRDKVEQIETALKLAPQASALMPFGLLDTSEMAAGRGGFLGNPGGPGMMMMRGQGTAAPPGPPPAGP